MAHQRDADGRPKFMWITLRRWKGNQYGMKKQRLKIPRNYNHEEYCPVCIMTAWLSVSGITSGPLFPALNAARSALFHGKYNASKTYSKFVREAFIYVGGPMAACRSHSIRKSAVKWGIRCGAEEWMLIRAGRWATRSGCFLVYVEEGMMMKEEFIGTVDPVRYFWVWTNTTGAMTNGHGVIMSV